MTESEIITRVSTGDVTVLDDASRWEIEAMYRAGKLQAVPPEIKPHLLDLIDSCRESR